MATACLRLFTISAYRALSVAERWQRACRRPGCTCDAGRNLSRTFSILDHADTDTILDARQRILTFELRYHFRNAALSHTVKPYQRVFCRLTR